MYHYYLLLFLLFISGCSSSPSQQNNYEAERSESIRPSAKIFEGSAKKANIKKHHNTVFDKTTRELQSLNNGKVAIDIPAEMDANQSYRVVVRLTPNSKISTKGLKKPLIENVKVGSWMRASLNSPDDIKIIPIAGDHVQAISLDESTEWQWSVIPQKKGKITLTVVIDYLNGAPNSPNWTKTIKVLDKDVDVRVKKIDEAKLFINWLFINWKEILAVLSSLSLGFIYIKKKVSKDKHE